MMTSTGHDMTAKLTRRPRLRRPLSGLKGGLMVCMLLGSTVAATSLALAQEPPPAEPPPKAPDAPPEVPIDVPPPPAEDAPAARQASAMAAQALMQMHVANQVMIVTAELAMDQAELELVRRYGERLWRDHRMSDRKTKAVAEALEVQLEAPPPELQLRLKQAVQQLQAAGGTDLDRAYVLAMRAAREQMMLPILTGALAVVEEPRVVELIEEVIPILEQHIVIAEHVDEQLDHQQQQG